jgi:DNA helicase HerA-like ATPase
MSVLSIDSLNGFELQTQTLVGRSIAVLGITGSGKTNTAAVLIEELLSNDLPLTIVDIEGEYWGLKERFEILVAGVLNMLSWRSARKMLGSLPRFQ